MYCVGVVHFVLSDEILAFEGEDAEEVCYGIYGELLLRYPYVGDGVLVSSVNVLDFVGGFRYVVDFNGVRISFYDLLLDLGYEYFGGDFYFEVSSFVNFRGYVGYGCFSVSDYGSVGLPKD